MPDRLLIRGCDALVAPGELREDVDIEIIGDGIVDVRPTGQEPPGDARSLDGSGLVAMPGLVNAHTHSPENCLRGSGECLPLEVWLIRMFGTAGRFDPDDHYTCALAGAVEMLLTGTTAVLDHLWGTPPTVEGADAALRAYRDAGIRAAVAPLVADADFTGPLADSLGYDLSGALFTDLAGAIPAREAVAQIDHLMSRWHGQTGRLQVFAGPVGVQWCSDELLQGLADAARRHGTSITLHLLESALQDDVARHRFGASAVEGLDRLGILGRRCSLAHGVWLDPGGIRLIAERGSVVVHNPSANFRLGSGRAPVRDLLDSGVRVALGTDGSASSDNQVTWTQLRLAALVHNAPDERWVSSRDALTMATRGGAAALGLEDALGALEPGRLADIALIDRGGLGLVGAQELEAGLVLSETGGGVVHVIVGGEQVVEHGRCVKVDQDAVRAAWHEQAERRRSSSRPTGDTLEAMERMHRFKRLMRERPRAS